MTGEDAPPALDLAQDGVARETRRPATMGAAGWGAESAVLISEAPATPGQAIVPRWNERKTPRRAAMLRAHEPDLAPLVRRMVEGDQDALAALYDATSPLVYGLALRILRDRSTAEEVTIDVYTQAFHRAASYDTSRGTPWAWLVTLARSRASDRRRSDSQRLARQEPLESVAALPSPEADPEEASFVAERARLVRTGLATLTPKQRQAIEIAYFAGLSHTGIAARLGEPLGTVKTRIRTGMIRLREYLAPYLSEDRR